MMVKKENTIPLEDTIYEVEEKIKKSSDPYYETIYENLKQIQRELKSYNKDGSKNIGSPDLSRIKEDY